MTERCNQRPAVPAQDIKSGSFTAIAATVTANDCPPYRMDKSGSTRHFNKGRRFLTLSHDSS
jgi:hypothetical protein